MIHVVMMLHAWRNARRRRLSALKSAQKSVLGKRQRKMLTFRLFWLRLKMTVKKIVMILIQMFVKLIQYAMLNPVMILAIVLKTTTLA